MNIQQRNIVDGHTVEELAKLLVDLHYNRNTIQSTLPAREAGITPLMVAVVINHRLLFGGL
jgi:hypothetical protein